MKRRTFLKSATLTTAAFGVFPVQMFAASRYSYDDLIGKGNPELFGKGINLRKEAYEAFVEMRQAAAKEKLDIKIVSSYRDFYRQKAIWERKYKQYTKNGSTPEQAIQKIIEYSTIPGTSRHHWATDIDIIDGGATYSGDVLVPEKFHGNGPFRPLRQWLDENVNKYGFYMVYTDKPDRKGFKYEPWHYSYAPVSVPMLRAYKKLDVKEIITQEKVAGATHFTDDFIAMYRNENILDINPELIP
ncbi:M15 family metallopeptidase [Sinomicrobium weinanense]|uniref:M15 family metallopeptidase n=1 Tax=Sinomicrobium weinanense TaxID=2842200 RepID=A0A926JR38_9FLAO|nr:M15 family metallopeptidase [Sinomicrobium weinanense]MBC9795947.1 M15 family metallopeptidase [Sinomicrobium weinanense]MBU3122066.1 M15 family metallopeptidase [Sinomicrobium weinanense]